MKEAIKKYIEARAERIRPCKHNWELLEKTNWNNTFNTDYRWCKWTYRCKKCGKLNIFNNNI